MSKEAPLDAIFTNWQLQLRKGLLSYLVLKLLNKQELYGYALITALGKKLSGDMAEGTIYPLLNRMQRDELITFHWKIMESGPARKYYNITDKGQALMQAMQAHFDQLSDKGCFQ